MRTHGAVKMRRRKPADAAAHDHQVIVFAGRGDGAGARPEIGIAQGMRNLETSRMIAAQSGQRRRIISARILRRACLGGGGSEQSGRKFAGGRAARGNGDTVEKIPPGDGRFHARDLVGQIGFGNRRDSHPAGEARHSRRISMDRLPPESSWPISRHEPLICA